MHPERAVIPLAGGMMYAGRAGMYAGREMMRTAGGVTCAGIAVTRAAAVEAPEKIAVSRLPGDAA